MIGTRCFKFSTQALLYAVVSVRLKNLEKLECNPRKNLGSKVWNSIQEVALWPTKVTVQYCSIGVSKFAITQDSSYINKKHDLLIIKSIVFAETNVYKSINLRIYLDGWYNSPGFSILFKRAKVTFMVWEHKVFEVFEIGNPEWWV